MGVEGGVCRNYPSICVSVCVWWCVCLCVQFCVRSNFGIHIPFFRYNGNCNVDDDIDRTVMMVMIMMMITRM